MIFMISTIILLEDVFLILFILDPTPFGMMQTII